MSERFISYLRQKSINLKDYPSSDSNMSITGTLVTDIQSRNDVKLTIARISSGWELHFSENGEIFRKLPLPPTNWSYHCTFLQIEPDILFFCPRSEHLALVSMTIALASKQTKVPYPTKTDADSLLVSAISDPGNTIIRILTTEPHHFTDIKLVPQQKPFHVYSLSKDNRVYSFAFIPYLNVNQGRSLPPVPCFYPTTLPEQIYNENNNEAIFQGIRALYKRIDDAQADLDVAAETPLELTKQKVLLDIEKLESQIHLKKQALILSMNKKDNQILEAAMKTISPNQSIANKLDFRSSYTLPGKEVAAQIVRLISTLSV